MSNHESETSPSSLNILSELPDLFRGQIVPACIQMNDQRTRAADAVREERPDLFIEPREPRTPRESKRFAKNQAKRERRYGNREAAIDAKIREWGSEPTNVKQVISEVVETHLADAIKTRVVAKGFAEPSAEIEYLEAGFSLPSAE